MVINKMVDLHCHIIPGVDDGPRYIEDSLEMLKKAEKAGVDTVVATPHLIKGLYEITPLERERKIVNLQNAAIDIGINVQIKPGFECYLSHDLFDENIKLSELTINNNGKYILVELPMQIIPSYVADILLSLMQNGIIPVIAHPERNMIMGRNPNVLFDFVSKGCIAQLSAGSILGYFGKIPKKTAQILLTHKLIHLVASDMHSVRSPFLDQAVPVIEELLGTERTSLIFNDIPHQVLAGEELNVEPPQRYEPPRWNLKSFFLGSSKKR